MAGGKERAVRFPGDFVPFACTRAAGALDLLPRGQFTELLKKMKEELAKKEALLAELTSL